MSSPIKVGSEWQHKKDASQRVVVTKVLGHPVTCGKVFGRLQDGSDYVGADRDFLHFFEPAKQPANTQASDSNDDDIKQTVESNKNGFGKVFADAMEAIGSLGNQSTLGMKHDSSKRRYSLLPSNTLNEVVDVLEYGSKKYQDNNWQHVDNARNRYYDAAMRHIDAWWQGQINDDETSKHHLAHAICCLMFLIWFDWESE